MTATILLIRHAAHPQLGAVLSGRTPGIALSDEGQAQAASLARRLAGMRIDLLQSSPVQRARETAEAIAASRPGLPVDTIDALDELDFGDWSGRAFVELAEEPSWHSWNAERSAAIAPNGESMTEAQDRAWAHIEAVARCHRDCTAAMVTHCDIIRAAVAKALGLSLDHIHRFEIGPASVSRLAVDSWGAKVLALNEGGHA